MQKQDLPISAGKGKPREPDGNYGGLVDTPIFYSPALLDYQGADIRTERFCLKNISAPKGPSLEPNANYGAFVGTLVFQLQVFLND